VLCVCHRSVARVAAGVSWTWTLVSSAPWAGRYGHTSVIDATGTIYVIGGYGTNANGDLTKFRDVWASTNGGAHRSQSRVLEGVLGG
jgi:hypothetical protein